MGTKRDSISRARGHARSCEVNEALLSSWKLTGGDGAQAPEIRRMDERIRMNSMISGERVEKRDIFGHLKLLSMQDGDKVGASS